MNLRRLEYFLGVVDTGKVTAAATKLHIAQPALSRQLKTLERELKLTLFEPHGTGVVLTSAGRQFAVLARKLVAEAKNTEQAVANLRTGRVSMLSVASTVASIRGFVAPFIASTTTADPVLVVHVAGHFELRGLLDTGIDFLVSPTAKSPELEAVELATFPIFAHVSAVHPWAASDRTHVELADLCAHPLIVPSPASVSRSIIDAAVSNYRQSVDIAAECDDGIAILALASGGHGVGVTTEFGSFGTRSLTITCDGEPLSLPIHVAWRGEHFAAETIRRLAERMRDFVQAGQHGLTQ